MTSDQGALRLVLLQAIAILDEHLPALEQFYVHRADPDLADASQLLDALGHTCSILFPHHVFSPNLHRIVTREFMHALSEAEQSVCSDVREIRNREWGHFDERSHRARPSIRTPLHDVPFSDLAELAQYMEIEVPIPDREDGATYVSVLRRLRDHLARQAEES